jgi:hypothetical protein
MIQRGLTGKHKLLRGKRGDAVSKHKHLDGEHSDAVGEHRPLDGKLVQVNEDQ